jgi:cytochrome c peroxidase
MKRLLTVSSFAVVAALAMATGSMFGVFKETYKVNADSDLGKASCATCHTSKKGGKLNPYGNDVKTALGSSKKLTADVLKKVEGLDSDKDGKKNIEEIKAGSLPGAE